jgi:hypothetical protein
MAAQQLHHNRAAIVLVGLALGCIAVVAGHAQSPGRAGTSAAGSPASMQAEREQIWNSPQMLRARAWLQDYCSKSAKVTPEMAKEYQTELENMTPAQLKVWLLKFEHEESQRQQQYAAWQQAHSASLSRAVAADRATQQSYAAINREESEAAGVAQQKINEQQEFSQTLQEEKRLGPVGPYGPGEYAGYGGVHYHFHLYPYAY